MECLLLFVGGGVLFSSGGIPCNADFGSNHLNSASEQKNLIRGYLCRPWRYKNRSHIKSNGRSSQSQSIIIISRFSQPISREKREIKALRECEKNSRPHQVYSSCACSAFRIGLKSSIVLKFNLLIK